MTKPKEEGGLGFRDIHLFNKAMLSKQAWRLWTHPESLCSSFEGKIFCKLNYIGGGTKSRYVVYMVKYPDGVGGSEKGHNMENWRR